MKKIKILLVDDQTLFVESLKRVLNRNENFVVYEIAHNGHQAIESVRRKKPDLILMDVRMPELDGVEATKAIHEKYPDIKIIMLTTFDDDQYVTEAIGNGALGYLLKDISPEELIKSVLALTNSTSLFSPGIIQKLANKAQNHPEDKVILSQEKEKLLNLLTKREKEIFNLLIQGHSNLEIANQLFISEQTVKNHLSNIYAKIGVNSRSQAIQFGLT
jgi:DNA-binding NarL/FixJ family response regulator